MKNTLQIASTFACTPMETSLQGALANAGVAGELSFARFTQLTEYLLASAPNSPDIFGTVVLLRLEDWLRERLESMSYDVANDSWMRLDFRSRIEEFVTQIAILSSLGRPVWLLACPSNGWISEQHKLGALCRTYTNLVVARVRDIPQITVIGWPASMSASGFSDREADREGQVPFTQDGFNELGQILGAEIARQVAKQDASAASSSSAESHGLADYLTGLQVRVALVPASSSHREQVVHIVRTAASFSLMGEKPNISDSEVDAMLESGSCMLVNVSDRLSEYGPSGMVIFRSTADALVVSALALSCPVLGKQVEYAVLSALSHIAAEGHLARIILEYHPSQRNQPTLAFLRAIAEAETEQRYVLPTDEAEARINQATVAPGAWSLRVMALESAG
jgi:hypothetical protein